MDELRYYVMHHRTMCMPEKKTETALERNFKKLVAQAKRR